MKNQIKIFIRTILCFPFLIGFSVIAPVSCKHSDNNAENEIADQLKKSNYNDRINNVFSFLDAANFSLPNIECRRYIILQTNLCNACNENDLALAIKTLAINDTSSIFILASESEVIKSTIEDNYHNPTILLDTFSNLKKWNLSFLRNLSITTCENKIISWKYLY